MHFVIKLTLIILILNLKFNGLKTSPVIDSNKPVEIDSEQIGKNLHVSIIGNTKREILDVISKTGSAALSDNDNISYDNVEVNLLTESLLQSNTSNTMSKNIKSDKHGVNINREQMSKYFMYNTMISPEAPLKSHINDSYDPEPQSNKISTNSQKISLISNLTRSNLQMSTGTENNTLNSFSTRDLNHYILNFISYKKDSCLLDNIKQAFMWWSLPNGSLNTINHNGSTHNEFLDLSSQNLTRESDLFSKVLTHTRFKEKKVIAFSAANNRLNKAPYKTLTIMKYTLKYLTLKGNIFYAHNINQNVQFVMNATIRSQTHHNTYINTKIEEMNMILNNEKEGIAWATFPPLVKLIELDISNCSIEYVTKAVFKNLTNLRRLYLSHNKLLKIPADTFYYVQAINYLDLSFMNDLDYNITYPTLEAAFNVVYGIKIPQTTFKYLPTLEYLDFSHTKLTRNSAMAFTQLSEHLKFLSLCYTAFPMISNAIFKNTALIALDLSGNPYASHHIIDDTFEGVSDTLKYLFFEQSNIKDLDWVKSLSSVRVLGLTGNNINSISLDTFGALQQLQILDLSSNHVGNWYKQVFTKNVHLRILNLRDNNINIITTEMLKDFQYLEYLGISDNDFVCDCLLHDLMDIAASNSKDAMCVYDVLQETHHLLVEKITEISSFLNFNVMYQNVTQQSALDIIAQSVINRYLPTLWSSNHNLKFYDLPQNRFQLRFRNSLYTKLKQELVPVHCHVSATEARTYQKLNNSQLHFQLLDYSDDHYWCFNETEQLQFVQLNCQMRNYVGDIEEQLHTLTKYVLAGIGSLIGVTLLIVLLYLKRWHIHYYYSSLKSAALMSLATKESVDKFKELSEKDPNLVYDIFISYCQNDREWVLEELLPNVEVSGDISICMHERDFQIGLTILDNIISCMDRSRALMLIISKNFLLSHWCQFEMHLAQHRMFEASKEHMILVFLEYIPRNKRPKTLQYLMEMKTYINWPASRLGKHTKTDDKKLFWKRMKRSLENIGLRNRESNA